mgnify:CR=1 FL=1
MFLDDVSIHIEAGRSIALVGPSGGGKTTICSLLPRFYDVKNGAVRVDGQDIRTLTLESLRKAIGIVQQDVYLFTGSVKENIAYGNPDARMRKSSKQPKRQIFMISLWDCRMAMIPMSVSVVHDCQEDRSSASVLPASS